MVFDSANRYPDKPAIVIDTGTWTYGELADRVCRFAGVLKKSGVQPGDRVALMVPNTPWFTVAYFGILSAGAIVVPIHILLTGKEVAFCLGHSGARAMVFWGGIAEAARAGMRQAPGVDVFFEMGNTDAFMTGAKPLCDPHPTMPDDTAVIFYTSGTTGSPKGAALTHFNLYSNAQWVSERSLEQSSGQSEIWGPGFVGMAVLPLSHSFAQTCMQNAPLLNGGAISYLSRFDAIDLVQKMVQYRVSVMALVPRIVRELLRVPDVQKSALRYCMVGGAPVDPADIEAFEARFGVEVLEGYGLSETSPVLASRTPGTPRSRGSVGRPIRGVEMKIADDRGHALEPGQRGEIAVKGYPVMKGYYRNPEATAETIRDGWLYTGDIGFMDEMRRVYVIDRKKDVIIRSGFSIYPIEVEDVLRLHPAIREAAVVGVPDEKHGEEIKAIVVGQTTEEELSAHCRAQLAAFKCPRIFEFRPELPKGIKGQILRRLLR